MIAPKGSRRSQIRLGRSLNCSSTPGRRASPPTTDARQTDRQWRSELPYGIPHGASIGCRSLQIKPTAVCETRRSATASDGRVKKEGPHRRKAQTRRPRSSREPEGHLSDPGGRPRRTKSRRTSPTADRGDGPHHPPRRPDERTRRSRFRRLTRPPRSPAAAGGLVRRFHAHRARERSANRGARATRREGKSDPGSILARGGAPNPATKDRRKKKTLLQGF